MVDSDGADLRNRSEEGLGSSLKGLRTAAGLTQEELAEQAGVSARTISDVERGVRSAVHHDTARRLAAALRLEDAPRLRFEALARGREIGDLPGTQGDRLPAVPTPFLGRMGELESITALLQTSQVRLLTLTGAGGIGKTRLAVEAARALVPAFPDGVFFVSLGEVMDASLVASELARAIGAVETGQDVGQILAERLAGRRVLIVLDTFEHLTPAAPLVYSLLLACSETSFLVTSRSALRLRGEQEFPVPPLESPADVHGQALDEVIRWPATALFWDRARAVRPDLPLDADSVSLVVEICRRLDGLPLAIELAAARVKHLPLAAIQGQLEHRLEFLVGGPLDLPLRQRAIRDTVAWSHGLLDERAQLLFRRLSVFAGSWGLDDVAGVCGPATEIGNPLEGISGLVDQSLVVVVRGSMEARYDMLDVIREYAARRLSQAGEYEEISRRHALHFVQLAEETEPRLMRTGHQRWFQRLDMERANLRAGMAWAIGHAETVLALRYVVALWRHWRHLGDFAEGRGWLDSALALPGPAPVSLRARALGAAGALAFPQGDHERMAVLASEAYKLAQQSEDRMDLRNALTTRGMVAMVQGRYTEALDPFRESVAICSQLGLSWQLGTSYLNLGVALLHAGFGDEAVSNLEEGGRVYRRLGDEVFAARTDNTLAHAALARGEVARADALARAALQAASAQQERQGIGDGLHTLAAVAAARSDPDRAATLAGAAAAVRETIAAQSGLFDLAIPSRFLESMERAVTAERWHGAWQAGYELDAEAAVAYALNS